jgi:hypothetical protein
VSYDCPMWTRLVQLFRPRRDSEKKDQELAQIADDQRFKHERDVIYARDEEAPLLGNFGNDPYEQHRR